MKSLTWVVFCSVLFISCKEKKTDAPVNSTTNKEATEAVSYFPVTSYLKGQLADIRASNVNPLEYTIVGDKKDSVWLKNEDLETAMAAFLHPEIDNLNMIRLFKEEKFLDQSVNAYTFTYDPAGNLPDTMQLQHWDVYVDPQEGKVRRIYMLKKTGIGKQQQLTWEAEEKWCRILNISTKADGTFIVDKEQKIIWHF
jgi:hypothetical protein